LVKGIRDEMQQGHAEHQSGNKTDCRLQPRMGEPHGQQHERAADD
jgi:murein endopeptidase